MIHVYKSGGAWKSGDKEYTVKAINAQDKKAYALDGWVDSIDKIKAKPKTKAKAKKDDNKK